MSDVQLHHPHALMISQIVRLQHRDWIVNFHRTLCQNNVCADWFAEHGTSSSNALKSYDFYPSSNFSNLILDGHQQRIKFFALHCRVDLSNMKILKN